MLPLRNEFSLLLLLLAFTGDPAMAIEEPVYEVLLETRYYEVRRYQPYIVAEADVDDDFERAGSSAFRVLAGYIFGDNQSRQKMQMTAPVTSQAASGDGPYTYAFVMERKYTMDTLPKPDNPDISLVQRPQRVMAVHRYSGGWSEERYRVHEQVLLEALAEDRIEAMGTPVFARYNAPYTPWFLRRNEVMVEVDWKDPD